MKKHLVYAEDLVYEIMQYPSKSISKTLIRDIAEEVIATQSVSIWRHILNTVKGWFTRNV
jgi:hypothetical protein